MTNKEKAVAFIRSLETGAKEPVGFINPQKYIQHNLMVEDGLEGFGKLLQEVPAGTLKAKVVRAFEDGGKMRRPFNSGPLPWQSLRWMLIRKLMIFEVDDAKLRVVFSGCGLLIQ